MQATRAGEGDGGSGGKQRVFGWIIFVIDDGPEMGQ